MAYVSPTGPLPPNNSDPISPAYAAETKRRVDAIENAVKEGRRRVQQMPAPMSFADIGLPVVKGAMQARSRIAAANDPSSVDGPTNRSLIMNAPQVVPLNVSVQEYNGCCVPLPGAVHQQPQPAPLQRIAIKPAPVGIPTPQGTVYVDQSVAPRSRSLAISTCRYQGMGGLGFTWGDSGRAPCGPTWRNKPKVSSGGLMWLALAALGVWAIAES